MHKCVKQNIIVHFIIQKLKNKHFPQKACKLRKLNPLILTEREDSKTTYFPPRYKKNRYPKAFHQTIRKSPKHATFEIY